MKPLLAQANGGNGPPGYSNSTNATITILQKLHAIVSTLDEHKTETRFENCKLKEEIVG